MHKIIIIGCPGSGKSTFSFALQKKTGLPLYHLDNIWWNPDRTHINRDEMDKQQLALVSKDEWIIDGDYSRTYSIRFAACDTIFFLDYPESVCMTGITERIGKDRPDIPWTEQWLDPELVEEVKNYAEQKRPMVLRLIATYSEKQVFIFHSREETEKWLSEY